MHKTPTFKTSIMSRLFGSFASKSFPHAIQVLINKAYTKAMNVDLSEFEDVSEYTSLNKLFTRNLKIPRQINTDDQIFISPCDSFISACGTITKNLALQIKGFSYRINELLGENIALSNIQKINDGAFINFYLSPKDYHRYHVPIGMTILKAVHIPGKLYPVNLKWLKKVQGLFIENERVVLECKTEENKLFYMIFVGALNVGKMRFTFDNAIQTNATGNTQTCYEYEDLHVKKGEELGRFEMGSTIVMLFEKESFGIAIEEYKHVKFGENIGKKLQ